MDAVLSSAASISFNGLYTADFGADGLDYMSAVLGTGGTYAGQTVTYAQSPTVVEGASKIDVKDALNNTLFSFYIDSDTNSVSTGGDGSVTLNAFSNLSDPAASQFFNLTVNGDGTYTFDMISNTVLSSTTVSGGSFTAEGPSGSKSVPDGSLTVYGGDADPAVENVNSSSNGIGLGQPTISEGEWLKLDFAKLQTATSFHLVQWGGNGNVSFKLTIDTTPFDFNTILAGVNNLSFSAGSVTMVKVVVDVANAGTYTNVGGVLTVYVAAKFDNVTVENAVTADGNAKFGLNTITYDTLVTVEDLTLNFQLGVTDGDGDSSTLTDALTIAMVAPDEPVTTTSDASIDALPGVVLVGNGENDTLTGGAGNDILLPDGGNDSVVGNGGTDTVSYEDALAGVTVNLSLTAAQNTMGAGIDTLSGIENLTGSAHDDVLTGSNAVNVLIGGAGNDTLIGGDGSDTLIGGLGNDTLTGGTGDSLDTTSDVFKWNLGDQGSPSVTPAADTITDFYLKPVSEGGDVLDLKDLLTNEHSGGTGNLSQYLHFGVDGGTGKVMLSIDQDGTGTFTTADQTIKFDNYSSLSSLQADLGAASTSDDDIIAKMIANGNLKTDV